MNLHFIKIFTPVVLLMIAGCRSSDEVNEPVHEPVFLLASSSFANNDSIPFKFSCSNPKAANPNISWSGNKPSAKSYVLIMDDPDAIKVVGYVWTHWLLYNIPAGIQSIAEGKDKYGPLPAGVIKGTNSSGDTSYIGPCPPKGQKHTYIFRLYGIDQASIGLAPGATTAQVRMAIKGHITDSIDYKGTFIR